MSARRGAFFWLSAVCATIIVIALLPLMSLLLAGAIASSLGCSVNEGGVTPCPFWGGDLGEMLLTMLVLGWLGFATLPFGGLAVAVWLVAWLGRLWWRRSRA